jgi:hypothetical protein
MFSKTPINISIITFLSTTLIVYVILYYTYPDWITNDDNDGVKHIDQLKTIGWSVFFGLTFSIISMLILSKSNRYNQVSDNFSNKQSDKQSLKPTQKSVINIVQNPPTKEYNKNESSVPSKDGYSSIGFSEKRLI